jgi:hypothetical protein
MKKHLLFFLLIFEGICAYAQTMKEDCPKKFDEVFGREVYTISESPPEYPQGMEGFYKFLFRNLGYIKHINKLRPERLRFEFIVEENGKIKDVKVFDYQGIEFEITITIPQWQPAKCNGKNVPFKMVVPIVCIKWG